MRKQKGLRESSLNLIIIPSSILVIENDSDHTFMEKLYPICGRQPACSTSLRSGMEPAAPGRVTLMEAARLARSMHAFSGIFSISPAMK